MVNLLAKLAARIASLINRKPYEFNLAVASTTYRGVLKGYSLQNIRWLCKQIAHETGWGTSRSIKEDQNAWGMNCVSIRLTTQISCRETSSGEVLGQYRSIDSSCVDRLLWDDYWGFDANKRDADYPVAVCTRYHANPSYNDSVSSIDSRSINVGVFTALFMIPVELLLVGTLLTKGAKFFK